MIKELIDSAKSAHNDRYRGNNDIVSVAELSPSAVAVLGASGEVDVYFALSGAHTFNVSSRCYSQGPNVLTSRIVFAHGNRGVGIIPSNNNPGSVTNTFSAALGRARSQLEGGSWYNSPIVIEEDFAYSD